MNKSKAILFQGMTLEDYREFLTLTIEGTVRNILDSTKSQTKKENQLLTPDEVCELLKIDRSTLWRWTNDSKVKAYGISGRRYYKLDEILNSLQPLKS